MVDGTLLRLVLGFGLLTAPGMLTAEPDARNLDLPPDVSTFVGTPVIEQAFEALPLHCRKELQSQLRRGRFAIVKIDGSWSDEVAKGVIEYVAATGTGSTLVYNLKTVSGAKGLIWNITASAGTCPTTLYAP